MKSYPSIPNSGGQSFEDLGLVHVFDKLDGSNLRMEYSRKRGWYKFGSRTQMIDESSAQFGAAIPKMQETGADILACFGTKKPDRIVVFGEWHGPNSFAGLHDPDDDMRFSMFDICMTNRGWMDPNKFVRQFVGRVDTPDFLGTMSWSRGLIQEIRDGALDDQITFEGVVGKVLLGPRLKMGKAKTQRWIDKVHALYEPEAAEKLVLS